jgi:K+-transporting ATPase KdpF subunit
VRPGRPVILELLAGVVALLVLVYLVWTLLRPEDF